MWCCYVLSILLVCWLRDVLLLIEKPLGMCWLCKVMLLLDAMGVILLPVVLLLFEYIGSVLVTRCTG